MMNRRLLEIATVSAFVIATLTGQASAAGFRYCIPLPDGSLKCFDMPVEEVKIKIPLDPGPYIPIQIHEIAPTLAQILGEPDTTWVIADVVGQRAFLLDLLAEEIYELDPQAGM